MPPKDIGNGGAEKPSVQDGPSHTSSKIKSLFSIPGPVKRLFESVPVLTYAPNELPRRAPKSSTGPSLYVFSNARDAAAGRPSFNPGCLKWQAFLKIADIDHRLVSSNNHASPTGVLPFLIPAFDAQANIHDGTLPIPSNKLMRYAVEHGHEVKEPASLRYEAYQALLDHRIRRAWLYNLYLEPSNFTAVAHRLYVQPTSSSFAVRATIAHQLRTAAETELRKIASTIDVDDLYSEAIKAFEALSILLAEDEWFFGHEPSLFDASVFAYTHLLLDEEMGWKEKRLVRAVRKHQNLVQHRERLLVRYFRH